MWSNGDPLHSKITSEADIVGIVKKSNSRELFCTLQRPGDAVRGVFGDNVEGMAIMLHTPCLELDSLGNFLSEYFESILCAAHLRVHYAAISFLNPKIDKGIENRFFEFLPRIMMHNDPLESKKLLQCPCNSICHEWIRGLMHHNGHMARIGRWFRTAMDAWISQRLHILKSNSSSFRDQIIVVPFQKDHLQQVPQMGSSFHISTGAGEVS